MENEEIQEGEEQEEVIEQDDNQEQEPDWKARATELEQKAIKQRETTKALKAKLAEYEKAHEKQKETGSNEPDYSKIAYLNTVGITHPEDQKWAQDEANRLKLPLTDVLAMEHAKARLQANKDQREAMAGMPKGSGRGGSNTQNDVDYWLAKPPKADGTYETPSDPEIAIKVINARINKEKNKSMFSDDLY